ncbi:MAG: hypothetical protein H6705_18860 [Myxococcales bacterium]|nr:hypothetical protein [Myxococcales bacterium]
MSAEDTLRASAPLRDRLPTLIGDPIIPPHWRGRADAIERLDQWNRGGAQ